MLNQSLGWWSSVGCDSLRNETYRDVKTLGNDVRGQNIQVRSIWGRNVQGLIVPVPFWPTLIFVGINL
jgi:hypothetical protein